MNFLLLNTFASPPFLNQILVLIINSLGFSLLITVTNHRGFKEGLSKSFVGMSLSMALWVNFAFLSRLLGAENSYYAEVALRIAWFATPFLFFFTYLTSVFITNTQKNLNKTNIVIFILVLLSSIFAGFTDFIIKDIYFKGINLYINYGIGLIPFLMLVFFIMLATVYPVFIFYKKNKNKHIRYNVSYFLVGLLVFYIANLIFNISLPMLFNISHLYYIGDYSTIFLVGFTTYSIVKHQFLNIKVISTELFTIAFWIFILLRALIARDPEERLVGIGLLVATIVIGTLLIKSVIKEVKVRKELEIANKRLKELDNQKDEFISVASHELKTPIGITKTNLWMLKHISKDTLNDKQMNLVTEMEQGLSRLSRIINNLLDISRIEQGRFVIDIEENNLDEIIKETIDHNKHVADQKGLKILYPKNKVGTVCVDKDRFIEILDNLISNAIKYTNKGLIKVTSKATKSKIIIAVTDTGPGISLEDQKKLFKKFSRTKEGLKATTSGASTGLGLYIAKKIIEEMGGDIGIKSKEGKGSTFWFTLPIRHKIKKDKKTSMLKRWQVQTKL